MPPYNGFTHEERALGGQIIRFLVDNGWMAPAEVCSISGARSSVHYHCENYYEPWDAHPICRQFHLALHRRFRQPAAWVSIVAQYSRGQACWYSALPKTPYDLAARLRVERGDEIRDVRRRVPNLEARAALLAMTGT
jgi:hypothetical protein